VIGIAREVAAATGTPLTPPVTSFDEDPERADEVATVGIDDLERCSRYLARVIRGVRHVHSPIGVQARLTAAGMRPISAAVDATNYAMLETGQPLHPFDLALLKGPGIVVRRAADGETLVTLDEVERSFTPDDLLICDLERPVAVAGVMGGQIAEVSEATSDILLESASFERGGVQRTRRRIELSSEASMRFERGVDPEAVPRGADRACQLMVEWCGARVLTGVAEAGAAPERRRVGMRASRASALIGYDVTPPDAVEALDRLAMPSAVEGDVVTVEVPGYRPDIEREVDLIEEVVRVQGYERVGSTLPPVRQAGGVPPTYAFLERVRHLLVRAGLREVQMIPFASQGDLTLTGDAEAVRVTNPIQADESWLRARLLPGLLKTVRRNLHRQVRSVAVFEVGTVFRMVDGDPQERPMAALAMTGAADAGWTGGERTFDLFDAKGALESLMAELGVPWTVGEPLGRPFHPGRSAAVMVEGAAVGTLGEIHPSVAASLDLTGRVAVAELELTPLMQAAPGAFTVADVPRFPPARRDVAFVLAADAPAGPVQAAIEEAAGPLLGSCLLFDVFEGGALPPGRKSLAFSLDLRAPDRTLASEEADAAVAAIAERLARDFGAELRAG
jgi:phenylalanyl-tRNA synthetase beta chain